jgi:ribose transport system substrate-binding protein
MKKIIALLLAVVMILGLAACAGSSSTSASTPAADSAAASSAGTASASASASSAGSQAASASASTGKDGGFVIGFSNYNNEISWRTQMEAEFTNYADTLKQQGVISNYYVYEANGDQAKQISDIQDLITMGVDAIVLPTITSDGLNDVLQEAMDEGIIVVNFDNNCSLDVNCKLTVSDYNHGQVSGDWLADQLIANKTEKGNVIILRGAAGTSTDANRYQGGYDALTAKCPDVNIVAEVDCAWDYATAKTTMETLLATYPQIDGVLSQGGAMTQAAIDAFLEAGRPLCPMTGEGGNGFLKAWIDNADSGFQSMAFFNPAYSSRIALDCAVKLLQGGTIEDCSALITDQYKITPEVDGTSINMSFAVQRVDQEFRVDFAESACKTSSRPCAGKPHTRSYTASSFPARPDNS